MKFVYFGYDFTLPTAQALIKDGHELIGLFSFPTDNVYNFNNELIKLGRTLDIPISLLEPQESALQNYIDLGADLFLCSGYPFKIPPIDENKAYALNIHPTYLPMGRGLMPVPEIILNHPEAGGFTIHKMVERFDAGDILYQEHEKITQSTNVDSYSTAIQKRIPPVMVKIAKDLPAYWDKAQPQDETKASIFKTPSEDTRTLNWSKPLDDLDRVLRAFGSFGALAVINGRRYAIFDHDITTEEHDFEAGTVIEATKDHMKIAAQGGHLILKKFQIL